jgi:lupus La protein
MADTENTAAAATNSTEVPKTETSVDVQSESKTEEKATKADDGEEKWDLNGKSQEKNDRGERSGRFGRNDNRDGGRGRGRGRGNFQNNRKK